MEIPYWVVEIFRLEHSRGTRKMIEIFCGIYIVELRFLYYSGIYWVLDFYRILWALLVVDIAVHSAKNLSSEEGNKGFV